MKNLARILSYVFFGIAAALSVLSMFLAAVVPQEIYSHPNAPIGIIPYAVFAASSEAYFDFLGFALLLIGIAVIWLPWLGILYWLLHRKNYPGKYSLTWLGYGLMLWVLFTPIMSLLFHVLSLLIFAFFPFCCSVCSQKATSKDAKKQQCPKCGDYGLTKAAKLGKIRKIKRLLSAGADVNLENKDGNTALMSAIWRGHSKAVEILIDAGADVNSTNKSGDTALNCAEKAGQAEIVNLLKEAGAK